mmetsp:Transcript_50051/g.119582  ORF Transcript_50051/g.119582 Transcript_50051/m.119582 type:complete len:355 (-) Transcript_50051:480-1544(-)
MPFWKLDDHTRICQRKESLHWIQVGERGFHVNHLVQDDSQGPDVRRAAHLHCALLHSLWRHIANGAHGRLAANVGGVACDPLCDAEVDELQALLHEEEVPRLQVGVHHALAVNDLHRLQHLLPQHLHLSQGDIRLSLKQPAQIHLPFLHDYVNQQPLRQNLSIQHLDDVLAVLQLLQQCHFVGQCLEMLWAARRDSFQRQLHPIRRSHPVDLRSPTAPDGLEPGVGNTIDDHGFWVSAASTVVCAKGHGCLARMNIAREVGCLTRRTWWQVKRLCPFLPILWDRGQVLDGHPGKFARRTLLGHGLGLFLRQPAFLGLFLLGGGKGTGGNCRNHLLQSGRVGAAVAEVPRPQWRE